ncbi:MAG: FadR/GntR family transcriptional regulator [Desulfosarcinaceae bacterium]|nr:FadR/GntR family transcriptional regulator [Desulfosarcinaceae bacterium]
MHFTTIHKPSAPEMVAEQILAKIRSGDLTPGSRLPAQRELAILLGVGRSSVREAINALVVTGVLEAVHGKGTFVTLDAASDAGLLTLKAALGAGSLIELMEARELLECKTAALAAERADSTQIAALHRILRRLAGDHADYRHFLRVDLQFHFQLAEATGNRVICELTKLVLDKVVAQHGGLDTARLTEAYRTQSITSARQVVAAVEKGDSADAAHWMAQHLYAIRSELMDILPPPAGTDNGKRDSA